MTHHAPLRQAARLRDQQLLAQTISVFIETNPFSAHEPQYGQQALLTLS